MVEKLVRLLAGEVEKLAHHLTRWHGKLKNWHVYWRAFGTLGLGHVDHAGIHGTHYRRFSKLIKYRFTIMDKIFIQGLDF